MFQDIITLTSAAAASLIAPFLGEVLVTFKTDEHLENGVVEYKEINADMRGTICCAYVLTLGDGELILLNPDEATLENGELHFPDGTGDFGPFSLFSKI